mgnify:CR=1 FL=1
MNDVKAIDNERVPYQLPMPKEALSEIVVPDALAKEDGRMWVQQAQNVYFRPLCPVSYTHLTLPTKRIV